MICGGMFLSYGVFDIIAGYQQMTVGVSTAAFFFVPASFHIAMIVGVVIGSIAYNSIEVIRIHVSSIAIPISMVKCYDVIHTLLFKSFALKLKLNIVMLIQKILRFRLTFKARK